MATTAIKLETTTGDICREFAPEVQEVHEAYETLNGKIGVKLTDYSSKALKARYVFNDMLPLLKEMRNMLSQRGAKRHLMDTANLPTWTAWFKNFKIKMQLDVTFRHVQRLLEQYEDKPATVKTRKKPLEVDSTLLKQMAKYLAKPDKKKAKALVGEITRRQAQNKLAEATICEDLHNRLNLMLPMDGDSWPSGDHVVIERVDSVISKLQQRELSESDMKRLPYVIGACKEIAKVWGEYAEVLETEPAYREAKESISQPTDEFQVGEVILGKVKVWEQAYEFTSNDGSILWLVENVKTGKPAIWRSCDIRRFKRGLQPKVNACEIWYCHGANPEERERGYAYKAKAMAWAEKRLKTVKG